MGRIVLQDKGGRPAPGCVTGRRGEGRHRVGGATEVLFDSFSYKKKNRDGRA